MSNLAEKILCVHVIFFEKSARFLLYILKKRSKMVYDYFSFFVKEATYDSAHSAARI